MKIKLTEIRNQKKWSQSKLSLISGVSRTYISEIEAGKYNPTIDIICKLTKALGCSLDDLVDCDQ
jgi:transcriptional regulator with XRE-family HTH domain